MPKFIEKRTYDFDGELFFNYTDNSIVDEILFKYAILATEKERNLMCEELAETGSCMIGERVLVKKRKEFSVKG